MNGIKGYESSVAGGLIFVIKWSKLGSNISSNRNDIETKRNDISIIGVFSVSKQNEPAYYRTLKDRNKANIFMSTLCRLTLTGFVQNFPGSNKNELD
jgi:hypothetical protein